MLLDVIKNAIGISSTVTVYDAEIQMWIEAAKRKMVFSCGVPDRLIEEEDPRALAAIVFYVKANFGNDRTDSEIYMELFKGSVRELQTDDGGIWDDVDR